MWQKSFLILILSVCITDFAYPQEDIVKIEQIEKNTSEIALPGNKNITAARYKILKITGHESILQNLPGRIILEPKDILPEEGFPLPAVITMDISDVAVPGAKYTIYTGNEDKTIDLKYANYRCTINNDGWINLSFSESGIIGWIRYNGRTYLIQPLKTGIFKSDLSDYFIYETVNQAESWCGVNTESLPAEIKRLMTSPDSYDAKSSGSQITADLAVETDYETYLSFNKDSILTTAYLLSAISTVSAIYEQEINVKLRVIYSRVWTTINDPYTLTGYSLFNEFRNYWNANMQNIDRDAAVLIIRDPGRLAGGMAAMDALGIKNDAYAVCGENITVITHEFGHIFGSPHTHNCSWPAGPGGTLAPIDKCATVEGDCGITEIIPQEGTIMSYCPTRILNFGPLVNNLIRSRAETRLGNGESASGIVTGKITSGNTGISNVIINAYRSGGNSSTVSAADGSFSMNLFYDYYTIYADRDGYLIKPSGVSSGYYNVTVSQSVVTGINYEASILNPDQFEPDDNIYQAKSVPVDASKQAHTLHSFSDRDYVKFEAIAGKSYFFTLNSGEVLNSPSLYLYDTNGTTLLQTASSPPSIVWKAPQTGIYYLRVSGTKGFYDMLLALAPFTASEANITPLSYSSGSWGDYDMDGDQDLLISGVDNNYNQKILLYKNNSGILNQTESGISPVSQYSSNMVKWIDIDNDNDPDAFTGGGSYAYIYRNDGGIFTSKIIIDDKLVGFQSADFCDYDNDGDLDILIQSSVDINSAGDVALIHLYRNDQDSFQDINLGIRGVRFGKAIWGDYDSDGDPDILVTGASIINQEGGSSSSDNPFTRIYRNDQGTFTDANSGIADVASFPDIALGDYDNDGDLDVAISGQDPSKLVAKIYRNDIGIYTETEAILAGVRNAGLEWGDCDNDGDLDLIITGQEGVSAITTPSTKIYINNHGNFEEAYFNTSLPAVGIGSALFSDFDNDTDLDILLTGAGSDSKGRSDLIINQVSFKNSPPSRPGGLISVVNGNSVTLSWDATIDDKTPSQGLTYNLYVGKTSGGIDIISPMADLQTGRRLIPDIGNAGYLLNHTLKSLKPGTYYWSVQAIDNCYAGGQFAPVQTFEISSTTDLELPEYVNKIIAYPNPASDILTIELSGNINEIEFYIFNSTGQIVYSGRILKKIIIPISSFKSGTYYIRFETGRSISFVK